MIQHNPFAIEARGEFEKGSPPRRDLSVSELLSVAVTLSGGL